MGCILCSCAMIPLEYYRPEFKDVYWKFEIVFTSLFTLEYLVRWFSAPNRFTYPFTRYALIDLIAIVPALLMLSSKFMVFRLVRGIRFLKLLRLLKFFRYDTLILQSINNLRIWFASIRDQYRLDQLGNLFRIYFVAWVIGANLLYFTESQFASGQSPYADYFKSYWNIIIVLISGIEDKEPLSLAGRIEVTVLLIAGICVVGMITGEIVSILVQKIERKGKITIKPPLTALSNHIVIIGNNAHLDYIIHQVYAAFNGLYYILVVCPDAENIKATTPEVYKKVMALQGDYRSPEVLKNACLDRACRAIILSEDIPETSPARKDNHSLLHTLAAVSNNTHLPVTVELQEKNSLKYTAPLTNAEFVVSRHYLETLLSQAVLHPGVTNIYRSLMIFSHDSNEFYKIPLTEYANLRTFKEAQRHFLNSDQAILPIGIFKHPETSAHHTCYLNPASPECDLFEPHGTPLEPEDSLVVMAYRDPSLHVEASPGWVKTKLLGLLNAYEFKSPGHPLPPQRATSHSFTRLRNNAIVICNCNPNIKQIAEELCSVETNNPIQMTLIVQDQKLWDNNPEWHPGDAMDHFNIIHGDPCDAEVLKKAGVRECGAAIVLADPNHGDLADAPSTLIAMSIENINPDVHTIMELIKSVNRQYIDHTIINEVVCRGDITKNLIAQNCFLPGVTDIFHTLLTTRKGTPQIFLPCLPERFAGKSYKDIAMKAIENDVPYIIIGFIQDNEFVINPKSTGHPGKETVLSQADQLIVISHHHVVTL